jgi:hypothetical protein
MTAKSPPIDPRADLAAMMRERRIADRIVFNDVSLSDIAEGREPIPSKGQHLRSLCLALGCQPYYIDRIVREWRAFHGEAVEPAAPVAPTKVCAECSTTKPITCKKCRLDKTKQNRSGVGMPDPELTAKPPPRLKRGQATVAPRFNVSPKGIVKWWENH